MSQNNPWMAMTGYWICLFVASMSWMCMKLSAIWADLDLGFDDRYDPWIVSIYIVMEVALLPVVGRLIDRFGLRLNIAFGVVTYIIGCTICFLSPSIDVLVIGRAVQGLGGAFVFGSSLMASGLFFERGNRNRINGLMTASLALGSFWGASIGYWFACEGLWRYIFVVSATLMLVGGLIAFLLTEHCRDGYHRKIDLKGIVLLTILGFVTLFYTQMVNIDFGIISYESLSMVSAIIVLILLLYVFERRHEDPAVPMNMTSSQWKMMAIMFVACLVAIGIFQYLVKAYILVYDMSLYEATCILMVLIAGGAVTSVIGCKKVLKTGLKPWILLGSAFTVASFLIMYAVGVSILGTYVSMFILGLGLGCMMTELVCCVQENTEKRNMGAVTCNIMYLRLTGVLIGLALYSNFILNKLIDALGSFVGEIPSDVIDIINILIILGEEVYEEGISVFNTSVHTSMLFAAVFFLIVPLMGLWLGKGDLKDGEEWDRKEKAAKKK